MHACPEGDQWDFCAPCLLSDSPILPWASKLLPCPSGRSSWVQSQSSWCASPEVHGRGWSMESGWNVSADCQYLRAPPPATRSQLSQAFSSSSPPYTWHPPTFMGPWQMIAEIQTLKATGRADRWPPR